MRQHQYHTGELLLTRYNESYGFRFLILNYNSADFVHLCVYKFVLFFFVLFFFFGGGGKTVGVIKGYMLVSLTDLSMKFAIIVMPTTTR